jgi:cation diffusion facilitator family transporter
MNNDKHCHNKVSFENYPQEVKKTLLITLGLNWLVAILKLIVGYLIKSTSMVADGYHSFSDGASNIIGIAGMRIASQPQDKDHPYGHKKYETFTSIFIAFLLFLVCFYILHSSLERFSSRQVPEVNFFSFLVMGVTTVINIAVMAYEYKKGKRIGSDILVSDSLHTRADILTSFSVIFAFIGVKLGYPIMDAAVAVVIAVFIGFSAIDILRNSSKILCDTAVIDSKELEAVVLGVDGVKKCHRIRTRGRRDDIYIDLHVLVDDKTPLIKAHDMSSQIEGVIKDKFYGVTDVIVHIEPLSSEKECDD